MNPDFRFQKCPFLYVLLAFLSGILLARFVPSHFALEKHLALTTLIALAALIAYARHSDRCSLILALAAIFFLGALQLRAQSERMAGIHVDKYFQSNLLGKDATVEIVGHLSEDPELQKDKMILSVCLEQIRLRQQELPASGHVRISLHSSTTAPDQFFPEGIFYGDRIRTLVNLKKPRNFLNPGNFDYAGYLKINDIDAIATLKSPDLVEILARNTGNPLLARVYALRRIISREIKRYFACPEPAPASGAPAEDSLHNQEAAVILALFLGDRILLNARVEEGFKKTGVYHVLVVSGAHVAIIAFLLFQFLAPFRIPEGAKGTFVIAAIIFYTLLIGPQPSVLRASVMIIVYLIGRIIYREGTFLNSTSFAAFLLLVFNPLWLFDIGSQLSFAAVFTICLVGIPFSNLLVRPYLWGLSTVFSDRLFVAQTFSERRTRHIRFSAELFIEAALEKISYPTKQQWTRMMSLLGKGIYHSGNLVIISIAIEIVLFALIVPYFNRIVLISPLVNLIVVPVSTLILFLMLFFLPVIALNKTLASGLSALLMGLTKLMLVVVTRSGDFEFAQYRIPTPPAWVLCGFVGSLVCAIVIAKKQMRCASLVALTGFALLIAIYPFAPHFQKGQLSMTVLDVGQGDSIFVQFPRGTMLLVDGGGLGTASAFSNNLISYPDASERHFDIGEQVISPFLWAYGIKKLDYVALTHAHHDHLAGLPSVIDNFRIGHALEGRNPPTNPEYAAFLKHLDSKKAPLVRLKRNDKLEIDGVTVEVFNPKDNSPPTKVSNNDSVAFKLTHKNVAILLTGDIEKEVELDLLDQCAHLKSLILKVPHHGSKSSSTEDFLNCVQPGIGVISAGAENPFGHPHPIVLERYRKRGIKLYQTPLDGAVTISTDGDRISVEKFRKGTH